jgi:two-component system, sensor histidine kinase
VTTLIDEAVPKQVMCDRGRLKRALLNLVSNAVKFTENGRVDITVRSTTCASQFVELEFGVRDTGIGISEDQQRKIFEPFVQADEQISQKFGGSGLGLSITKGIVDLMGGSISVWSRGVGCGATFTIKAPMMCIGTPVPMAAPVQQARLQIETGKTPTAMISIVINHGDNATVIQQQEQQEQHQQKQQQPIMPLQNDTKPPTLTTGTRVLLAEDNIVNQKLACQMIDRCQRNVEFVNTGKEALRNYQDHPDVIKLILMDIHMPEMDGLEATHHIREWENQQTPKRPPVPIVAMTADISTKFQEAGMQGMLVKPVMLQQLKDILNKYMPTTVA